MKTVLKGNLKNFYLIEKYNKKDVMKKIRTIGYTTLIKVQ